MMLQRTIFKGGLQIINMGTCTGTSKQYVPPTQMDPRERSPWLRQFDIKKPELACPQSYEITNVCISKTCQAVALFCENPQCPSCSLYHQQCGSIKLSVITGLMQKRAELQKDMATKMQEIQLKVFQLIQTKRAELLEGFFLNGFQDKFLHMVESLYFGSKKFAFQGKLADELYWKLRESNSRMVRAEDDGIKHFKREMERVAAPFMAVKRQIMSDYLTKIKVMSFQTEKQLTMSRTSTFHEEPLLKSSIIPKHRTDKIKYIFEQLDFPKKINQIFRASDHNFKASSFHQHCNNKVHTLTLVETQFGKILAGYTPLAWTSLKGFYKDQQCLSFLLSLDLKQKFSLKKPEKAIQCHPDYGPVFGSGADLAISDECNLNTDSCVNFPFSYNYKNPYRFSQDIWTALCGARQGKNFRVKEYEVFEVIW